MNSWLSSWVLVVVGACAVGAGCRKPGGVTGPDTLAPDAGIAGVSTSGGSSGASGEGNGASGGGFILGDGGRDATGCPSSCDALNANCGFVTDTKCGGVVQCGTCSGTDQCGGSVPNRCGPITNQVPDGGACVPSTCTELGASCGFVTDARCGGVIDCGQDVCPGHCKNGTCSNETCTVVPETTCAGLGYSCGQTVDNCGHVLDCGPSTCPTPGDSCIHGVCAPPPSCLVDPATTCEGRGYSCGQAADNCGHLLTCGPSTCSRPGWTCGGGALPGVCGCTGACSQIPDCDPGLTTTLSGKVYDPAGRNPLYHVLVYVANAPADPALTTFPAGVTCDVCGASAAGSPLISTPGAVDPPAGEFTGVDGSFTLKNVPAGNVTVVIQLGRWRRTFVVNVDNPCGPNLVPDKTLLMPSSHAQGNIPLMAMVTGNADSLECVLRKMGIAESEFTDPDKDGRVHFYLGDVHPGQAIDAATPSQAQLFANGIDNYDMTILACRGEALNESLNQAALRKYAAQGGRVFTTHYGYTWLNTNDANTTNAADPTADNWSQVAAWHTDQRDFSLSGVPVTGILDFVHNPKANAFQGWLAAVGALNPGTPPGLSSTTVFVVRHDTDFISPVAGRTQQWLYRNGAGAYVGQQTPLHFTFNTPVNLVEDLSQTPPAVQCGRVLFSDFHVNDANESPAPFYPSQCALNVNRASAGKMVCQSRAQTPCTLATVAVDCPSNDLCVSAGTCTTDAQCTGACSAGKCPWGSACTTSADCASTCSNGICLDPMTAQEKLLEYMLFDLGSCVPKTNPCVPKTSCPADQNCGYAPDGCNGLIACGLCPAGQSCGVGQPPIANQCGQVSCSPKGCPANVECGFASDGCIGVANCGTCPNGQTCNNGKCGSSECVPKSCAEQAIECGQAGDRCGNSITCPACPGNNACVAGKCVPLTCQPKSCEAQGIECGQAADGCGNRIESCGDCPAGNLCNAGKCVKVN